MSLLSSSNIDVLKTCVLLGDYVILFTVQTFTFWNHFFFFLKKMNVVRKHLEVKQMTRHTQSNCIDTLNLMNIYLTYLRINPIKRLYASNVVLYSLKVKTTVVYSDGFEQNVHSIFCLDDLSRQLYSVRLINVCIPGSLPSVSTFRNFSFTVI